MPLFVVDPARCKRDGVCVAECPSRLIALGPDDPVPSIPADLEERCIRCGHCITVCQAGAVTFDDTRPDQLQPLRTDWPAGPDQMAAVLRARRSIRSYASRPVEREQLLQLLDIARIAPSASNRQPITWLIVYQADEVRRLAGLTVDWLRARLPQMPPAVAERWKRHVNAWGSGTDMICRGAPHLLVACAPAEHSWGWSDCATALAYLELAAPAFRLGTCWAGILTNAAREWQPLQQALDIPAGQAVFGALMIGHPRHRYYRVPQRQAAQIHWRGPNPA